MHMEIGDLEAECNLILVRAANKLFDSASLALLVCAKLSLLGPP